MSDKIELYKNTGNTKCYSNILASIIALATEECAGVARISTPGVFSRVKRFFSRKYYNGIKFKFNKNGLAEINIFIDIFFGFVITDVAFRIQENVKSAVSSMLDVKTAKINIHVLNVIVQKEDPIVKEAVGAK